MTPALLSEEEIDSRLEHSAWRRDGEEIEREWEFSDGFTAAIRFVDRVAELAERLNHHPDILVHGWNKVKLSVSTHSAGGLTDMDFRLAEGVDQLA